MKNIDILVERLKILRKENGFSVDRVSKFCCLSSQEYLKLENGETQYLTIDVIAKLSLIFDLSCDYLIGLTNTKDKSNFSFIENSQDRDLYRKILLLSDKEKEVIRRMTE